MSASSSSSPRPLGIIGGSSYLNSTYIKEFTLITVNTKYGDVLVRTNTSRSIYFIQRHAADPAHEYSPPHLINKKAIIACFQQLNVSHILAFGSVGSLKRTIPVGTLVVCDDYLNLHDQISFYEYGKQGHLVPTLSADLRTSILSALRSIGLNPLPNGTYTQTTGPRFETPAEIRLLAGYADVVGMTCAHEAALANELGIPYAVVCMVDNMANGLADKNLTEKEFHDGVKRNLATMETVLGCLLNHLQPGSVKYTPPKSVHEDDKRTLVDLIVNARYIVPVEPEGVYENASLVVHDGKIIALMSTSTAHTTYRASTIEDHPQAVLFPGFINAHTHTGMSLLRGYSDDLCLYDWLSKDIWPAEAQFVNPTFVRDSTELAIAEMLRGGTTTFNDMYFYPEVACDVIDTTGIRAVVGNIVLDFPSCYADKVETYLEKGATLRKTMGKHPRITFSWAPHAPYTVCDDNLTRIRDLAKQDSCQIHTHLHETPAEVADSMNGTATGTKHRSDEKTTPIINFDRLGLITPNLMAIHMTQMTDTEITLFATRKAHVVHCPSSNLKLASGFAPVTKLLAAGVNVALGTDSTASNNSLDMSTEMKTAALIAKCVSMDATVVPAWQALRMATINGAKALGLESSIGSLSVGKQADFVALQLDTIETMPLFDVVSHIVYAASRYQVSDVWVSGRHLLRNRQLLTLDEPSIKSRVLSWQTKLTEFRTKTHPNEQHSKKRRLDDGDVSMANGQ